MVWTPGGRRGTSWQLGAGPVPKARSRVSRTSCDPRSRARHQMNFYTQIKQVIASGGLPKRSRWEHHSLVFSSQGSPAQRHPAHLVESTKPHAPGPSRVLISVPAIPTLSVLNISVSSGTSSALLGCARLPRSGFFSSFFRVPSCSQERTMSWVPSCLSLGSGLCRRRCGSS